MSKVNTQLTILLIIFSIFIGAGIGIGGMILIINTDSDQMSLQEENKRNLLEVWEGELLWPNGNVYYEGNLIEGDMKEVYKEINEVEFLEFVASVESIDNDMDFIVPKFSGHGIPHGHGRMYYEGGSLQYEGEFNLGRREGKGTTYSKEGNVIYSGQYYLDKGGNLLGR